MPTVLIVDDEPAITSALGALFERRGHRVLHAHTGEDGVRTIGRTRPELVLLDVGLPDMSGFEVLDRVRHGPSLVVMMTGTADVPLAVRAMQAGAEDFLTKPVDLAHLQAVAGRAFDKARLRQVNDYLAQRAGALRAPAVGSSEAMRELARQLDVAARNDATPVLLVGEPGTGKARLAACIHTRSARGAGAFTEINCAARAAAEHEAVLFGADLLPGAAPAAPGASRAGLLELTSGGTLLLDEVGALHAPVQARLLRVLEGGTWSRRGETPEGSAETRLIATTSRDLGQEVAAGRFREDLHYRLGVMPIHLPPLRARTREDVAEVITQLLGELAERMPGAPTALDPGARDRLLRYAWPGNVRELRTVLERAMILGRDAAMIGEEHLPLEFRSDAADGSGQHVPLTLEEVERVHVARALRAHRSNRTRAARELGISRATLIKKIRDFDLGAR